MAYKTARQIKEDILFRAGEPVSSTTWGPIAMTYLNRVYRALAMGASEFLPEFIEDWWWLRGKGVFNLEPVLEEGSVQVTKNNNIVNLTQTSDKNLTGWRLKVQDHPDIFTVEAHAPTTSMLELDAPYTGESKDVAIYRLMKVTYPLDAKVTSLISPLSGFRGRHEIIGMTPERLDLLFPPRQLSPGPPMAFSLEDEQTVRFSHGGLLNDKPMRVEYRFRPVVDDLTDSIHSIPLLPEHYRHLLADMALAYVLFDKNDDRANAITIAAKSGLMAMVRENRRRLAKMDPTAGQIYPRGKHFRVIGPLRTDAGLVIG